VSANLATKGAPTCFTNSAWLVGYDSRIRVQRVRRLSLFWIEPHDALAGKLKVKNTTNG